MALDNLDTPDRADVSAAGTPHSGVGLGGLSGGRPSSGAETRDLQLALDNLDTPDRADVSAAGTAALRACKPFILEHRRVR